MDNGLDALRRELAEAELDDGLLVFATVMAGSVVVLLVGARTLPGPLWLAGVVVLVPVALLGARRLRLRRQARRHRELERRYHLTLDTLRGLRRLDRSEPELRDLADRALRLHLAVVDLAADPRLPRGDQHVAAVLDGSAAAVRRLTQRGERVGELARALAATRETVRQPGRVVAVEARREAALEGLRQLVDGLEAVLAALVEAVVAAGDAGDAPARRASDETLARLAALSKSNEPQGSPELAVAPLRAAAGE